MKITMMIPTRRGDQILGCIHAMSMLESHEHEVTYAIGIDSDDPVSIESASRCLQRYRCSMSIFERLPALGSYHNELAARTPADVYVCCGDDIICISQNWDRAIAEAVEANPKGLWWMDCPQDRLAIYPVVSEQWRAAAGGKVFDDLYPYWYSDVHLREIGIMVTGVEVPRVSGAMIVDCPMPTTRMRDLLYWDDFFHKTRPARLVEAIKICSVLYPDRDVSEMQRLSATFCPNESFRATIDQVVETQGDKLPPTPSYMAAKQRADMILEKIDEIYSAAAA